MNTSIELPKRDQVIARDLDKPAKAGLVIGVLALAATALFGLGYGDGMRHFGHSMLVALLFFLAITIGALFFIVLQHITSAGWSVVVRRVAEAITGAFPILFLVALGVLVVPVLMGSSYIYDWASHDFVYGGGGFPGSELIQAKGGYFGSVFFGLRICFYFLVWAGLSRFFSNQSLAQDDDQDPSRTLKMQHRSGVSMVLFALATTFAAFDMSMSLNAEWFSTMYGVYFFAGCFWSFLATLALSTMWLEKRGNLKGVITVEHYHDIGKLLFTFTFFWSYVSFSQLMLYWYADIPEETHWFHYRMWGAWSNFALVLAAGHFLIPMLGLVSRHAKRRRGIFAAWCVYCLFFQFIDLYWNVMPEMVNGVGMGDPAVTGPAFGIIDITAMLSVAGLFMFGFLNKLNGKPALAIGDPRLPESLAFQNV